MYATYGGPKLVGITLTNNVRLKVQSSILSERPANRSTHRFETIFQTIVFPTTVSYCLV